TYIRELEWLLFIWNPSVRKSVDIVVGFGVFPDNSDTKLVKITVDHISSMWVVEVFMLSTRVWKTVYMGAPLNDRALFRRGISEKFGEVCLPEKLVHIPHLDVTKGNELLGLLEYYSEVEMLVCGVWSRKDGHNKPFTKIYTVKVEGRWLYNKVLGFRNNDGVVMEMIDGDNNKGYRIEVYEPSCRDQAVGTTSLFIIGNAGEGGSVVGITVVYFSA
ncbi:hypothetical protein Tco_1129222, partial [Tanacetum coccineum]